MRRGSVNADRLRGALIYAGGDAIAAWMLGEFQIIRLLGMMLVGSLIYATEIPAWFRWIDRISPDDGHLVRSLQRTVLALLYFNPLWIARHLMFILLVSGSWQALDWSLLRVGWYAFLANIPVALLANWLIQNRLAYHWRFVASALFSAAMAVYYALSRTWFA